MRTNPLVGELSWRLTRWSVAGRYTLSHLAPDSLRSSRAASIELQLTLSYPETSRLGTSGKPPNGRLLHVPREVHFLPVETRRRKTRRAKGERVFIQFFSDFLFSLRDIIIKPMFICPESSWSLRILRISHWVDTRWKRSLINLIANLPFCAIDRDKVLAN